MVQLDFITSLVQDMKGPFFHTFSLGAIELGNGFGINTNILETNIINLSVVITVVIYAVGGALQELLENRKKVIFDSFNKAEEQFAKAQETLAEAQQAFNEAESKVQEIKTQGTTKIQQLKVALVEQTAQDADRLETSKETTLRLEQDRIKNALRRNLVVKAMTGASTKLEKALQDQGKQARVLETVIPTLSTAISDS